jgi:hypothetical protein
MYSTPNRISITIATAAATQITISSSKTKSSKKKSTSNSTSGSVRGGKKQHSVKAHSAFLVPHMFLCTSFPQKVGPVVGRCAVSEDVLVDLTRGRVAEVQVGGGVAGGEDERQGKAMQCKARQGNAKAMQRQCKGKAGQDGADLGEAN